MPRWDGASDDAPCERRVDGDRITEMVQADIWLADPNKNFLIREEEWEKNPNVYLPGMQKLPRNNYRDHLHDVRREHGVYDPANPGLTSYVRVTRRLNRTDPVAEDMLLKARQAARAEALKIEQRERDEANELLELKSLGIRTAMAKYKELQDFQQDGGRAHTFEGKLSKQAATSAFFM